MTKPVGPTDQGGIVKGTPDPLDQMIRRTLAEIRDRYARSTEGRTPWAGFSEGGNPIFNPAHPPSFRGLRPPEIPESPIMMFRENFPIPVTITGNFETEEHSPRLERHGEKWKPAQLTMGHGRHLQTFDIQLRFRGHYRLDLCEVPPLLIKFDKEKRPEGMEDAKRKLKIVNRCRTDADETNERLDELVLLEHLAYEVFEVIGILAPRTRLLELQIKDEGGGIIDSGLALAQENEEDVAQRRDARLLSREETRPGWDNLSTEQRVLLALSNLLIGNSDFGINHNILVLERADQTYEMVPYDFDLSGFVLKKFDRFSGPPDLPIYPEIHVSEIRKIFFNGESFPYEGLLGDLKGQEFRATFYKAAQKLLSRKEDILRLANHPLLSDQQARYIKDRFNAFFEGLEVVTRSQTFDLF